MRLRSLRGWFLPVVPVLALIGAAGLPAPTATAQAGRVTVSPPVRFDSGDPRLAGEPLSDRYLNPGEGLLQEEWPEDESAFGRSLESGSLWTERGSDGEAALPCVGGFHGGRLGQPTFLAAPCFHPDDPRRHIGRGAPLYGTSWRNRPLHADWFIGALFPDPPIRDQVGQRNAAIGGYRLGWDFDHYWGCEGRLAFSRPHIYFADGGEGADNLLHFWDVHLLYYPWGDARWRPYASVGIGLAHARFNDAEGLSYHEVQWHVPFGVGVKYQARRWLALRLEAMDNLAVGNSSLDTQHNLAITAGVEVRFGARPTSYWPWNPGLHAW